MRRGTRAMRAYRSLWLLDRMFLNDTLVKCMMRRNPGMRRDTASGKACTDYLHTRRLLISLAHTYVNKETGK